MFMSDYQPIIMSLKDAYQITSNLQKMFMSRYNYATHNEIP